MVQTQFTTVQLQFIPVQTSFIKFVFRPIFAMFFQIIFSAVKNVLNFLDLFNHCLDLTTDQALGLIYPRLFQIQLCAPLVVLREPLEFPLHKSGFDSVCNIHKDTFSAKREKSKCEMFSFMNAHESIVRGHSITVLTRRGWYTLLD